VEDSRTQAAEIACLLEDAGHGVETAAQGEDALALIARAMPDAVVTDLVMPVMNGLQLVEAVRRQHPALPIILMTAHGSEEIAARALREGAVSYVPKAYLESTFLPTLENLLNVTRTERQHQRALEYLARSESHFVLDNAPSAIPPLVCH